MTKTRRPFFTLASAGVLALGLGAVPVFATSFGSSGGGSAGGFLHHKSGGGSSGGASAGGFLHHKSGGGSSGGGSAGGFLHHKSGGGSSGGGLGRRVPPPQERRRFQRRSIGRRVPPPQERRRLEWRILLRSCGNQHGPGGTVGKLVRPAKRLAITAGGEDGTTLPAIPVLLVPTNGELNREFASSLPGRAAWRGRPKESQ